jgi:hypothetical protein
MGKRHTEIHEYDVYNGGYNDELQQPPVVVIYGARAENGKIYAEKIGEAAHKKGRYNIDDIYEQRYKQGGIQHFVQVLYGKHKQKRRRARYADNTPFNDFTQNERVYNSENREQPHCHKGYSICDFIITDVILCIHIFPPLQEPLRAGFALR